MGKGANDAATTAKADFAQPMILQIAAAYASPNTQPTAAHRSHPRAAVLSARLIRGMYRDEELEEYGGPMDGHWPRVSETMVPRSSKTVYG
ncbi:hypothetical protein CcaCcLH18_02039 [Colletotrichum camelliae]|nr:hypothetical protein CcaCcLH18_02039 [Colletotrichum camelliae]